MHLKFNLSFERSSSRAIRRAVAKTFVIEVKQESTANFTAEMVALCLGFSGGFHIVEESSRRMFAEKRSQEPLKNSY